MKLNFLNHIFQNHCSGNSKFNFYKYMTRAIENDFKKVVGIRLADKKIKTFTLNLLLQ